MRRSICWVYPRVCGGSGALPGSELAWAGLSPRVRGKPDYGDFIREKLRSIPACAGEASTSLGGMTRSKVYPRVCGGSRTD